jgi:K(+)-stimulated pyrophosphate-energized sodium pump
MGLGVAGLAVLGLTLSYFIFNFIEEGFGLLQNMTIVLETLTGFLLELNLLRTRVGWWNLYKSCRCWSDLVGGRSRYS